MGEPRREMETDGPMMDAHMRLAHEIRELGGGSCSEYGAEPPTSSFFLREHVGPNRPAVWRGAAAHWPAFTRWSLEYLVASLPSQKRKGFGFQRRQRRTAECRHPTGRERRGSPALQTLQDPILLDPWLSLHGAEGS